MGPNTDPCGTPYWVVIGFDRDFSTRTRCFLPLRKDSNHVSAVPQMPISDSRIRSSRSMSTVSNAALRSIKIQTTARPESRDNKVLLTNGKSNVSVECSFLYPCS